MTPEQLRAFAERCRSVDPAAQPASAKRILGTAAKVIELSLEQRRDEFIVKSAELAAHNAEAIAALTEQVAALTEQVKILAEAKTPARKQSPKKPPAEKADNPEKKKYGEFGNVLLSDAQYAALVGKYGAGTVAAYIEDVDNWCQQQGKTYKDYAAAIRNFIKRDEQSGGRKKPQEVRKHSYDLEKFVQQSLDTPPKMKYQEE